MGKCSLSTPSSALRTWWMSLSLKQRNQRLITRTTSCLLKVKLASACKKEEKQNKNTLSTYVSSNSKKQLKSEDFSLLLYAENEVLKILPKGILSTGSKTTTLTLRKACGKKRWKCESFQLGLLLVSHIQMYNHLLSPACGPLRCVGVCCVVGPGPALPPPGHAAQAQLPATVTARDLCAHAF